MRLFAKALLPKTNLCSQKKGHHPTIMVSTSAIQKQKPLPQCGAGLWTLGLESDVKKQMLRRIFRSQTKDYHKYLQYFPLVSGQDNVKYIAITLYVLQLTRGGKMVKLIYFAVYL